MMSGLSFPPPIKTFGGKLQRESIFKLESYFYHLPEGLIAQKPLLHRDKARLLVINRSQGTIRHDTFDHLNDHLPADSCLVTNNSKVISARLLGKKPTGGAVEAF
jgi:S-adenosylmethionine:tRNA ribosyltransferase-isomerase